MTEDKALEQATVLLQQEATVETGKTLLGLEPYIDAEKFGDLWEAFMAMAEMDIVVAIEQ